MQPWDVCRGVYFTKEVDETVLGSEIQHREFVLHIYGRLNEQMEEGRVGSQEEREREGGGKRFK